MKSTGAEGLPPLHRESTGAKDTAANEEFARIRTDPADGWDPYEVWRVRVKAPARPGKGPARDPRG